MYGLTPRQKALVDFIKAYRQEHGYSPSYREMMAGTGVASTGNVSALLKGLAERQVVKFLPNRARSVVFVGE